MHLRIRDVSKTYPGGVRALDRVSLTLPRGMFGLLGPTGAGNDTEVPMDDLVEVGVFAAAEGGQEPGEPLYLGKHRVRSGPQTITVVVPGRPARAGIDPYHKLIVRHKEVMDDKVRAVEAGG